MYGYVNNWEIQEFHRTLPKSTSSISWLDKLSNAKLIELGYYKVIGNSPALKEWQSYGKATYNIKDDYIEETKEVVDMDLQEFKDKKIKEQSEQCQRDIYDKYSKEDQANLTRKALYMQDKRNKGEEVDGTAIQELRDANSRIENRRKEYAKLKESILNASSYEEVISLIPKPETDGTN